MLITAAKGAAICLSLCLMTDTGDKTHSARLRVADQRSPIAAVDTAAMRSVIATISEWARDPSLIEQVKIQNRAHHALNVGDIAGLDARWHVETASDSAPMIEAMLATPLSERLARLKREGHGLFTEIIVMDQRGLNVGLSDMTTDYWQGDEAKFQETFGRGPTSVYLSDPEFDISTQRYQVQVALPVVDNNQAIGAIAVGIDIETITTGAVLYTP